MEEIEAVLDRVGVSDDRPRERLDARELPPPEPLTETLERVEEIDDDVVLVQLNDRAPRHLYPKLDQRGYRYETEELEDLVVTVIER